MADDDMPSRASQGGADRARRIIECVDDWMFGEPLSDLFALFGRELPAAAEAAPPLDALAVRNEQLPPWLYELAADPRRGPAVSAQQLGLLRRTLAVEQVADEVFNFRGRDGNRYVERAQAAFASFDAAETERILTLADRLGLVTPMQPRHTEYAETLVLGGGYTRPLSRARHAHDLRAAGVEPGFLSFLGSARPLIDQPPERPAADAYAPAAADEFELLVGAARTVFRISPARAPRFLCGCDSADRICPRWRPRDTYEGEVPAPFTHERQVDLFDDQGRRVGSVLSASTGRPPDRPNTADTLELWARVSRPRPGQRVLVVTSQYFVPFQGFDCLRLLNLPYGVETDVVGHDDRLADPADRPGYLLMETLSAIRSARRLLIAAVEALVGPEDERRRPRREPAPAARGRNDDA